MSKPIIVGFAGGSASGKTSICRDIKTELELCGISCYILPCDYFYKSKNTNFDHPDAYDMKELRECVSNLKESVETYHPVYDYKTHTRTGELVKIPFAMCYLIEGIFALYDPSILIELDLKVFVDAESDTRLIRRIKRDLKERSRDIDSILNQYTMMVKPGYDNYILPTKANADFIVPNQKGQLNTVVINFIVNSIKSHFKE